MQIFLKNANVSEILAFRNSEYRVKNIRLKNIRVYKNRWVNFTIFYVYTEINNNFFVSISIENRKQYKLENNIFGKLFKFKIFINRVLKKI